MENSWLDRLRVLERQERVYWFSRGPYPRLLGMFPSEDAPFMAQAKRDTDAPIAISEEWYADFPEDFVVYVTDDFSIAGLARFWKRFQELMRERKGGDEVCIRYCRDDGGRTRRYAHCGGHHADGAAP